ncbi:hypothetical protein ACS0TY_000222 [Phlomoides rotata]
MASYAAVLSLFHTLNNINKHPYPPICLNQSQVDSLTQNLTFFQDFLERYSSEEDGDLESRIAAAAYAAEDVIETHIVNQIHARSNIITVDFYQGWLREMDLINRGLAERVIQEMDLIKREVMEIIQVYITRAQDHDLHSNPSGGPAFTWQSSTTPVFDEALANQVLDKLTGQQSGLQIIPIVGMGGIGKTTFARYIYKNSLIVHHFDILVWVTISQEYSVPEILAQVLCQGNRESELSDNELGERVHKMLWGRRYLIVMDDIWSTEASERVGCFFPDNNNGSRIMITTRLSNLAFDLCGSQVFRLNFLDEDKSWNLLCQIVFGNELGCPVELENIGKEIAKNCRGLPLSIIVIGGLLKKSNWTRAHWEYTLQNLNPLINLDDGENCLQILRTSYKELPIHLKPCFLYMGSFREDHKIRVTKLIELWVAEGILRHNKEKRLEEVAEEYIKELIDRNLIMVDKLRWNGKAKLCKIHDLLRDLCLREAQKQRFLCILKHQWHHNIPQCMNMERRICIHDNTEELYSSAMEYASLTRSLISSISWPELVRSLSSKLLRVYSENYYIHSGLDSVEAIFQKVNLRFLSIVLRFPKLSRFPSSWLILWNLQTLKVDNRYCMPIMAPSEIWEMPLLRHVIINSLELPDPVCGENDLIILEDLHTLSRVRSFRCSNVVIKRIPNIKTLKLEYQMSGGEAEFLNFGFNNIGHLTKLQSLNLFFDPLTPTSILDAEIYQCYIMQNLSFPHSLKKLTLGGTMLKWECMIMIGSLPLLQFLKLNCNACWGPVWETVEGQFCSLKFLQIDGCFQLRYWMTEDTHFPRLEHLVLQSLPFLEEIPSSIGNIPTLKSIRLAYCSTSVEDSAKGIKEEQRDLENIDLQLYITAAAAVDEYSPFLKEISDTSKYDRETRERFFDVMRDYNADR